MKSNGVFQKNKKIITEEHNSLLECIIDLIAKESMQ